MDLFSAEARPTDDVETLRRARDILRRHKLDTGGVDAAIDEIARQTEGRCFGSVNGGGLGERERRSKKKESEDYGGLMRDRYDY
ncbi:hypothetical protein A2635_03585 [Candidatus Peribacteria bacterium RIFCSPHIGHO2_01_FULL_51_9]|nr:MAG: hypothetical protein A2635_03585 [Candidatus Peribacteria bacterium RIFCSPHIGHO2_01_FULL_51_9]